MAMASGLFVLNWRDIVDPTNLAVDLTSASNIVCLFDNTFVAGDFDTVTAHGSLTGELATAGNYTQHNKTVGGAPTVGLGDPGQLKYTWSAAVEWSAATFTAYGMTVGIPSTFQSIVAVSFGGAYTCTNGTFSITAHANGIFYIDLVP